MFDIGCERALCIFTSMTPDTYHAVADPTNVQLLLGLNYQSCSRSTQEVVEDVFFFISGSYSTSHVLVANIDEGII